MYRYLSFIIALLAVQNDLFAAEVGMPQLDPKYWASQAFWLILVFTILYISIAKFYLPKIKINLDNRENKIKDDIDDANKFKELGLKVHYPGLESHPQHELMKKSMNAEFGFGGMLVLDVGSMKNAYQVMEEMQNNNIGYLAVSLGFYKTLFSAPGASTSSEIPQEEQDEMGISEGMIRMSIGLDNDIERTFQKMKKCLIKTNILK